MGGSSCILDPHEARAICKGNGVPCNFQHRACPRKWQGSILCTCFLIRAFFIFLTDLSRAQRASACVACAPKARGRSAPPPPAGGGTPPGGPPAQGASAPERASRPGGARGAPGRASGRAAHRHTAAPAAPRAVARAASHTKRGFCRTYLPYKIPAAFCMTVHFSRRDRRTGAGRRG